MPYGSSGPSFHAGFHATPAFHASEAATRANMNLATHHMIIQQWQRNAAAANSSHKHDGGTAGATRELTPEQIAEQAKFEKTISALHEPKGGPLSLVQLAQANFKTIDKDHNGTVLSNEMYSAIMDDKLPRQAREAAALMHRRFYAGRAGWDYSWQVNKDDLTDWKQLIKLHTDANERSRLLRNYTIGGGAYGLGAGAIATVFVAALDPWIESKFKLALPITCTITTGIGAWIGNRMGHWDLDAGEERYKKLL